MWLGKGWMRKVRLRRGWIPKVWPTNPQPHQTKTRRPKPSPQQLNELSQLQALKYRLLISGIISVKISNHKISNHKISNHIIPTHQGENHGKIWKLRRRLLALVALLVSVSLIAAACGSDSDSDSVAPDVETDQVVTETSVTETTAPPRRKPLLRPRPHPDHHH